MGVVCQDNMGNTPFHDTLLFHDPPTIRLLLNHGANAKNKDGDTFLTIAIRRHPHCMVQIQLDIGADPKLLNVEGQTPIDVACKCEFEDNYVILGHLIKLLIRKLTGVNISYFDETLVS